MRYRHEKREPEEYGRSPGNGITPAPLSAEPLASEAEALPEDEGETPPARSNTDPTAGDDPFLFDDIVGGEELEFGAALEFETPDSDDVSLPGFDG